LFYTLSVGINGFFRYNRFQQEFILKSEKLVDLKQRQTKINYMLLKLKETSTWETISREKLHMIKPDEIVYRFYVEEDR
jgi:cell division protein FtsB